MSEGAERVPPMTLRRVPGLLVRGGFMGLAEVVPGVSGGTIAFVTGIYVELVESIAKFGPRSIALIASPRDFWVHHNLGFLLSVAAGMGLGILLFANLMSYLLDRTPVLVWSFFFGLIGASVVFIGHSRRVQNLSTYGLVGLAAGVALLYLPPAADTPGPLAIFVGGVVAVCAWLLPAISGAFVLLSLGLYTSVIDAVANLEWSTLAVLAAGCATGLLLFARMLSWTLRRFYDPLLSGLTGFMMGSLVNLWPWQAVGQPGFAGLIAPATFTATTGRPALLGLALVSMILGIVGLWLLTRIDR